MLALVVAMATCRAATVNSVLMAKISGYTQTDASSVAPAGAFLGVEVELAAGTGGSSVVLARGGTNTPIPRESGATFSLERDFADDAALNAAFPDGAYTVTVDSGNPTLAFNFSPPAAGAPLRITNYAELQDLAIDLATIRWTPPASATSDDLVILSVERDADGVEVASATTGGTTSFWQFSGLPRDTALTGTLLYLKLTTTIVAGVPIGTGRGTVTRFPIRIAARDTTPPRVVEILPGLGGRIPARGPIVITFSEPMRTDNGAGAAPFFNTINDRYPLTAWSADGRQLTVSFERDLPPGYYSLRPFGPLADRQGNALEADTLVAQFVVGSPAPQAVFAQRDTRAVLGGTATIYTRFLGENLSYQWERNGTPIPGATGSALVLRNITRADFQARYDLVLTSATGTTRVENFSMFELPTGSAAQLLNLSVRTTAGSGADTLIVGFATGSGTGAAGELLLRGIGPGLRQFGVDNALNDPRLGLFAGETVIAGNEDWGSEPAAAATALRVGAFPLATGSHDAATVQRLAAGTYTVQIVDPAAHGMALAEIYQASLDTPGAPRLLNLSARAAVSAGNPLVAGFVIGGNTTRTVLIRAAGPALRAFGLTNTLNDPRLIVRNSSGLVASNNFWNDFNTLVDVAEAARLVGAFPLPNGSADAAVVATLTPGNYTAEVSSVDGTRGVALVEVYELP